MLEGNSTIREFEYKIAAFHETKYVLSTASASSAILGVFYAMGLSGQEVITTPLTWPGAISGLMLLNCNIKFCDVTPDTLSIDPSRLEEVITPDTKAVFSSDFLGYPGRLDELSKICREHNIWLIHDGASSFGARYKKKYSGYHADVSILSFGAGKVFSIGEGGCILTRRKDIFQRLSKWLLHQRRQATELNTVNPFALNTGLNPLAAEQGLKFFEEKINTIATRKKQAHKLFNKFGADPLANSIEPNYYKILIGPNERAKLPVNSLSPLPFQRLIYDEPEYKKYAGKVMTVCPVAQQALKNYFIYKTNL